jgi:hypothetical protein
MLWERAVGWLLKDTGTESAKRICAEAGVIFLAGALVSSTGLTALRLLVLRPLLVDEALAVVADESLAVVAGEALAVVAGGVLAAVAEIAAAAGVEVAAAGGPVSRRRRGARGVVARLRRMLLETIFCWVRMVLGWLVGWLVVGCGGMCVCM